MCWCSTVSWMVAIHLDVYVSWIHTLFTSVQPKAKHMKSDSKSVSVCVCVCEYKTMLNTLSLALDAVRNWCKARKFNQESRKTIFFFFQTIPFFTTRFTLWIHSACMQSIVFAVHFECGTWLKNSAFLQVIFVRKKKSNRKLACYLFK